MMPLVAGVSFHSAPLDVRERLTVTSESLPNVLARFATDVGPGVVLSTCNRAEFYTLDVGLDTVVRLRRFLTTFGVADRVLDTSLYVFEGEACARHLFRVAAGLDSMVVGETEVLGQVRDAFAAASAAGSATGMLPRLFHQAFHVGRRVRRETEISRNALSVSGLCVHVARRTLGKVDGAHVLVVGAGEAGKLAAQALRYAGAGKITIANRTFHHALERAAELDGVALPLDELEGTIGTADVVISATGAPGYLLSRNLLEHAVAERRHSKQGDHPMLVVDLAVPRDVDPAARTLPGLAVFDIDDLDALAEANRAERSQEARKAGAIVEEEVKAFSTWLESLEVMPTIAALRAQAEAIRLRELERTLRHMGDLTPEQREHIESLSQALLNQVLHDLTLALKEGRDPAHLQAVRELFKLDDRDEGR